MSQSSISETEKHYPVFKLSDRGLEGSLPFIAAADPDQVIGVTEVELREEPGLRQGSKRSVQQQQRVLVTK